MKEHRLIFDIGCYTGDDTIAFVSQGDKVVAVDANPACMEKVREKFAVQIADGTLSVVEGAIGNGERTTLYVSDFAIWTSTHKEIANRNNNPFEEIEVMCVNLADLMARYGEPYYCKIDIEQDDIVALEQIHGNYHPRYISCETECIGDRPLKKGEDLAVINKLKEMGYDRFCLVDQRSRMVMGTKKHLTGKFPEDIEEDCWMSYEDVVGIISGFDRDRLSHPWNFWVDVYATNK